MLQMLEQCPELPLMWVPLLWVPTEHQGFPSWAPSRVQPLYALLFQVKGKTHLAPTRGPESVLHPPPKVSLNMYRFVKRA